MNRNTIQLVLLLPVIGLYCATGQSYADEKLVLLSYFKDNGQDGVFLAYSTDGITFTELNDDKPIFVPPDWKDQNLTRDPSIVYHDGMFRMVWTSNWTGSCFGAASSRDLKNWSTPIQVKPFLNWPKTDHPRNVWAPEVHWNLIEKNFIILWSSTTPSVEGTGGHNSGSLAKKSSEKNDPRYHRTFFSTTSDFLHFTPAQLFFDPGVSQIDAALAYDDCGTKTFQDDHWIMAVKHEQFKELGGKNIRLSWTNAEFPNSESPHFKSITDSSRVWSNPVASPGSSIQSNHMVEGPTLLRFRDEWRLFFDRFDMKRNRFGLAVSTDLVHWTDRTEDLRTPPNARHGTFFYAPRSAVAFLN